jgi:biotin carboxyl carrier protein
MKMEIGIPATDTATVSKVLVEPGQQVQAGQPLFLMTRQAPDTAKID